MFTIHLSKKAQKVINAIYDHFMPTCTWPGVRTIRRELGRTLVESVTKRKKPSLVETFEDKGVAYYRLTFHGFMVCPKANGDIQMLFRYLEYLKNKFEENPEVREITSIEVEQSLKLSKDELRRLSELIKRGSLWAGGASFGSDAWRVGVVNDIEDLVDSNNAKEYVKSRLKKEQKRRRELKKRYSKTEKTSLLLWISFNINLWLVSYITFSLYPKALPIAISINLWFFVYSVSKLCEEVFKKKVPFFSSKKVLEKAVWWIIAFGISFAGWVILEILSN